MNKRLGFIFGVSAGIFIAPIASFAATVWADGVTEDSGWVDINKTGTNDSQLCWAAAASNIIDWWQKKADPSQVPAGTPQKVEDIFDAFRTAFKDTGRGTNVAWKWYFGGCDLVEQNYANDFRISDPKNSGRYWEDYVKKTCGYETVPAADPSWIPGGVISETASTTQVAENLAGTLKDLFERGYGVTLAIAPGGDWPGGHAITLWGMEYEGNMIKKLYITDSDDGATKLFGYEVMYSSIQHEEEIKDGKTDAPAWTETKIFLKDYYGRNDYSLTSWGALALPRAIPEPASTGVFFGTGLIGAALLPRKRK